MQALQARVAAAEARLQAARRDLAPDAALYGAWRQDVNPGVPVGTGYEAGLSLELPVFDWDRPARAGAEADLAHARASLQREQVAMEAQLRGLHRRAVALRLPAAPPTAAPASPVAATEALWLAGEADLTDLLSATEAVEGAALAWAEQARLARQARIALGCAAGMPLEPEIAAILEESLP